MKTAGNSLKFGDFYITYKAHDDRNNCEGF